MRYFIVDDDRASRSMLKNIITDGNLGIVIGEADSGVKSLSPILAMEPDIVLIDLLMPELDGIETIQHLRIQGFVGQFIMISQVVSKEMVGEAYQVGVEFFIHKPINRIEVQSVLQKTMEQVRLKNSLLTIRESLAQIGAVEQKKKPRTVRDIVLSILNSMGIMGSEEIVSMIEVLMEREEGAIPLPPLKELYEAAARKMGAADVAKESKAIEQRIRRSILTAIDHIASLGAIDYTNPDFEYYAPRFFDFQEISYRMKQIQEDSFEMKSVKVNTKKFLHVLFLETVEKYKGN
ncbi:response regulator [Sporosarcina sp. 179-K 3D1 HS]|uniref:response regulator n=1 Tax=Sporosarcina sp. 179-K 3D1 HS TaxID=3232169 RepID=UPI0039A229DC